MPRSGIAGSLLLFLNTTDVTPPQGLCNCCCRCLAYLFQVINTPHSFISFTFKYIISSLIILLTLKPLNPYVRSYGNSIFCFLRNFNVVLHSIGTISYSHPTVGGFSFIHPLLLFTIYRPFDDGHSDLCEVMYHYSLDLHFSND